MTIDSWITAAAAAHPQKPALHFNHHALSYLELENAVGQYAGLLCHYGVSRGDRVAYLGLNHPDIFILLFACARLGAVLVPVNWRLSQREIAEIISDCTPKLMISDSRFSDIPAETGTAAHLLSGQLNRQAGDYYYGNGSSDAGLDDTLLLVYTSGSTGRPKGVMLSQKAIRTNAEMSVNAHQMTAEDNVLCILPLFHVGGLNILATPAFMLGGTVILHENFEPRACLNAFQTAQLVVTVPTILSRLIAEPAWIETDLSGMRAMSVGSTDVPVELIDAVQQRGLPVIQIYGATETAPLAIYQRIEEAFDTVGSIGRQGCACSIEIRDHNGKRLPSGQPGEICIRGDNILSGYWQDEQLSSDAIHQGWFRSGDVGYQDEAGLFWFVDRIKHVIISGGENIYPAEIERVLRSHPDIAEVAVVGMTDTEWGEVPVAVIGSSDISDPEMVNAFLQGRLARYKHPRRIIFMDSLPRNAMGKVVASQLKDVIAALATS